MRPCSQGGGGRPGDVEGTCLSNKSVEDVPPKIFTHTLTHKGKNKENENEQNHP